MRDHQEILSPDSNVPTGPASSGEGVEWEPVIKHYRIHNTAEGQESSTAAAAGGLGGQGGASMGGEQSIESDSQDGEPRGFYISQKKLFPSLDALVKHYSGTFLHFFFYIHSLLTRFSLLFMYMLYYA